MHEDNGRKENSDSTRKNGCIINLVAWKKYSTRVKRLESARGARTTSSHTSPAERSQLTGERVTRNTWYVQLTSIAGGGAPLDFRLRLFSARSGVAQQRATLYLVDSNSVPV